MWLASRSFPTPGLYKSGSVNQSNQKLLTFLYKGFGGSAENDGTSKVYQKHEDEPVSSSDVSQLKFIVTKN